MYKGACAALESNRYFTHKNISLVTNDPIRRFAARNYPIANGLSWLKRISEAHSQPMKTYPNMKVNEKKINIYIRIIINKCR